MTKTTLFLALSSVLTFISCERSDIQNENETVSWPEITQFDNLAFQADGLVRVKDLSAVRELHAELLAAGLAVTSDSIPPNAANPPELELLLGDL